MLFLNKTQIRFSFLLFVSFLFALSGCKDNPESSMPSHVYQSVTVFNSNPFLIVNQFNQAVIFYGQDRLSYSGGNTSGTKTGTDGELDQLFVKKYDKNGNLLLDETKVVSTKAILDYAVLRKDSLYYIIWLDTRNNPKFQSGNLNSYNVDIYYKIIDEQGNIYKNDTRLTSNLLYFQDATAKYTLTGIYNGTLNNLKSSEQSVIYGKGSIPSFNPNVTLVSTGLGPLEYHIKCYGSHMLNSSKIIFTVIDPDSSVFFNESNIAVFHKLPGYQWGPEIQNLILKMDTEDCIHICWQINDGNNSYYYYYATVDTRTYKIMSKEIGQNIWIK